MKWRLRAAGAIVVLGAARADLATMTTEGHMHQVFPQTSGAGVKAEYAFIVPARLVADAILASCPAKPGCR